MWASTAKRISTPRALFWSFAAFPTTGAWLATGRHYYTKFEVIERIETEDADDDLFADTGLYDEGSRQRTVRRTEFHLGLIPTPAALVDKHLLSVASILLVTWSLAVTSVWWTSLRRRLRLPIFNALRFRQPPELRAETLRREE